MTIQVIDGIVIDSSRNVRLGRLNTDPGSVAAGTIHFNAGLGVVRGWNGTQWVSLTQGASTTGAWGWGDGGDGQLGTNSTASARSPVSVVGGFTDWVQISAHASSHTAGLRSNGQIWTWGYNKSYYFNFGALGDGTFNNRSSPVSVVGGFTDWVQVSAGGVNTAGIRSNGQLWTWGRNNLGQLGNGNTTTQNSPVSVVGGFTDWVQVSISSIGAGIRSNGQLWTWGRNTYGSLGDGTTTNRSSPVSVLGGFTDWIQVSSGGLHVAAIRANGTAWAWGNNGDKRLGDNTYDNRSSPISVLGGFTDWVQISAGSDHTAGLRTNGTAWAWGDNGSGRLGDGTTTNRGSPVSVIGGFTDWIQISAGGLHTTALRADGTVWCWGYNVRGQLGDNTTTNRSSPVSVVGGFTNWISIDSGSIHTAALRGSS